MNEILQITILIALLTLALVPFFITANALFPLRMARTSEIAARLPGRSFFIGLVNFLFLLVLALVLFSLSEKAGDVFRVILLAPALLASGILLLALSLGLGSLANLVGERTAPNQPHWKRTLWGTLLLGTACAVPISGWFLLLPYAAWVGMGAFIAGFFRLPQ